MMNLSSPFALRALFLLDKASSIDYFQDSLQKSFPYLEIYAKNFVKFLAVFVNFFTSMNSWKLFLVDFIYETMF